MDPSLAKQASAERILLNRNADRARRLADQVATGHPTCQVAAQPLHYGWRTTEVDEIRFLVNTTSVGRQPSDPPLFEYSSLTAPMILYDLIYSPPETPLLQAGRARGCRAGNALRMLLYQGALAFEWWRGNPAPVQAMRDALGN